LLNNRLPEKSNSENDGEEDEEDKEDEKKESFAYPEIDRFTMPNQTYVMRLWKKED